MGQGAKGSSLGLRGKNLTEGVGIHELCFKMHHGGKGPAFFGIDRVTMKVQIIRTQGWATMGPGPGSEAFLRLRCSNSESTIYEDS